MECVRTGGKVDFPSEYRTLKPTGPSGNMKFFSYIVHSKCIGIITARIRSVRECNVFTHVCLSVCSTLGGGSHVTFSHDALNVEFNGSPVVRD